MTVLTFRTFCHTVQGEPSTHHSSQKIERHAMDNSLEGGSTVGSDRVSYSMSLGEYCYKTQELTPTQRELEIARVCEPYRNISLAAIAETLPSQAMHDPQHAVGTLPEAAPSTTEYQVRNVIALGLLAEYRLDLENSQLISPEKAAWDRIREALTASREIEHDL
ncbi:hypothetical protein BAUCODRAFT_488124 [Baudoinia panamericana UAMH 10762]|uniref:Uncharacterized protein n=1 Tax=Baudoinia panamericana (strain UAMH 10762) TaxID=717646 RepID=M2NCU0_BAUPA|nr:uncharacterized protein BAUCODRAFT_488124 [Baudoinia panamericana UAMH 10762]EMC96740.1 hypothetical protein BAUCODRAFT_488124 [Baudoinia panamericana UAMH 10762]